MAVPPGILTQVLSSTGNIALNHSGSQQEIDGTFEKDNLRCIYLQRDYLQRCRYKGTTEDSALALLGSMRRRQSGRASIL